MPRRPDGMYPGSSPQSAPTPASIEFEIATSTSRSPYRFSAPLHVRPHSDGVLNPVCQIVASGPTTSRLRGPMVPVTIQSTRPARSTGTYARAVSGGAAAADRAAVAWPASSMPDWHVTDTENERNTAARSGRRLPGDEDTAPI